MGYSTLTKPPVGSLKGLAKEIDSEHRACLAAANDALDHAIRAGELLAEAKASCEHGRWQQWLSDHFNGSTRTARLYMQLAERREELEAKRQGDTVLSVSEARRLITDSVSTLDGIFPPEMAAIIDVKLNGPFCRDDFNPINPHWLATKIVHQAKLPTMAGFALTTEVKTEIPILRAVPYDELVEALRIVAAHINGDAGLVFTTRLQNHSLAHFMVERMAGALIVELEHREELKTDEQYEAEHRAACEQFAAACHAKLAELGAAT